MPFAALDIGSNTIRLLVSRYAGERLEPLYDSSEFVRLGKGVDASGRLSGDRMFTALAAIRKHLAKAHELGAGTVDLFATSAVRDASNRDEFIELVREATNAEIRVLTGDEEARLTFLGATFGQPVSVETLVCDLGGGSSELICARQAGIEWATSLQMGSGRLTELFVTRDPPQTDELAKVTTHVEHLLQTTPPAEPKSIMFTGGTASHVLLLLRKADPEGSIRSDQLKEAQEIVATYTQASIVTEYAIRPERAEVLPAGITAIAAILQHFGLQDLTITTGGIREGSVISQARHTGK